MAQHSGRPFEAAVFREIHKNTWLTKINPTDSKKKKDRFWTVFCVHDDTDAYLELYSDNKLAILHRPDHHITLNETRHVSPTICPQEQEYEFVLTLTDDTVRLAAPTWDQMLDWVESLRGKLHELRILDPKENIYTKPPETRASPMLPTRDPTSPLPPPPAILPVDLPGVETVERHPVLQRGLSLPEGSVENENVTVVDVQSRSAPGREVFSFDDIGAALEAPSTHYERLYHPRSPGPSNRNGLRMDVLQSRSLQPPPQPYRTLREQQVLQLQREMQHPSGVRLQLRRKDCMSAIALVDAMNVVWICGWKQKEHPLLYNALHIGDQLLSIDGIFVKSSSDAQKILRTKCSSLYVSVVVKRVPFGKVFVIHRDVVGQPLGIVQEGNTAVIHTVHPDSLAARCGLTAKATTCDGLSFTNWVLTEINGRPLNLFFKENQVRDRLNCVGKDISILVQPLDLIKQLKKQLKALRGYKEYVLQ